MTHAQAETAQATLFDRVGGAEKLRQIVAETVEAHLANPAVQTRFQRFDPDQLKTRAYAFFAQATGGPAAYDGAGLRKVHEGMNISEAEFVAVTDDLLGVLRRHGVGEREQSEVLAAFFMWKDELLHT